MDEISHDEFSKTELKVGMIMEAEKVKNADKLLKLKVDLGGKHIQLVAGIAQHYSVDEVVGKKIIVVANLKPAKLKGIVSEGMLLAAVDEEENQIVLLTTDKDIKPGANVQ